MVGKVVFVMVLFYIIVCLSVIVINVDKFVDVVELVLVFVFILIVVIGGFLGVSIMFVI